MMAKWPSRNETHPGSSGPDGDLRGSASHWSLLCRYRWFLAYFSRWECWCCLTLRGGPVPFGTCDALLPVHHALRTARSTHCSTAHCSLRTAHCALLTAHCSLPAHCSLLTAYCSLLTAHCSTAHCALLTACSLLTAHGALLTAHCRTAHCSLRTAHCPDGLCAWDAYRRQRRRCADFVRPRPRSSARLHACNQHAIMHCDHAYNHAHVIL